MKLSTGSKTKGRSFGYYFIFFRSFYLRARLYWENTYDTLTVAVPNRAFSVIRSIRELLVEAQVVGFTLA